MLDSSCAQEEMTSLGPLASSLGIAGAFLSKTSDEDNSRREQRIFMIFGM